MMLSVLAIVAQEGVRHGDWPDSSLGRGVSVRLGEGAVGAHQGQVFLLARWLLAADTIKSLSTPLNAGSVRNRRRQRGVLCMRASQAIMPPIWPLEPVMVISAASYLTAISHSHSTSKFKELAMKHKR